MDWNKTSRADHQTGLIKAMAFNPGFQKEFDSAVSSKGAKECFGGQNIKSRVKVKDRYHSIATTPLYQPDSRKRRSRKMSYKDTKFIKEVNSAV